INWALGVGASMAGFSVGMVALGAIMLTGIGAIALLAGIGAVAGVAGTIVAVSHILKKGSYTDNFPSLAWAVGSGAALSGFAIAMGVAGIGSAIANLFDFLGGDSIEDIAHKVVNV